MFRISRKCFPAKHRKIGFRTTPTPFKIGSHIIRNRNHPIVCTSFGGSLGGSACNGFFSIWAHEVDPLCKFYFKHQEIILRIQRNKRECWSSKCHEYLRRHKKSWRFTTQFQHLTIWRFSCFWSWAFLPIELPEITALSTSPLQPQPGGFKTKFPWTTPVLIFYSSTGVDEKLSFIHLYLYINSWWW